jgi:hypothetical protein
LGNTEGLLHIVKEVEKLEKPHVGLGALALVNALGPLAEQRGLSR